MSAAGTQRRRCGPDQVGCQVIAAGEDASTELGRNSLYESGLLVRSGGGAASGGYHFSEPWAQSRQHRSEEAKADRMAGKEWLGEIN